MGEMLRGKVAVVTGAGRGIGRGVALELADQGAKVVVNDYGVSLDGREPTSEPGRSTVVAEIQQAGGEAVANADSVADVGRRRAHRRAGGRAASAASTSWSPAPASCATG